MPCDFIIPNGCPINSASIQLLLDQEVGGGESYYNKKLLHPEVPGDDSESGITIGIGEDLSVGVNSKEQFLSTWKDLGQPILDRLTPCIGISHSEAEERIDDLKDIVIPWNIALNVFLTTTVPTEFKKTTDTFPGFDKLPQNAQGALVSLVFNRGTVINNSDRRKEMKNIRDICIPNQDLQCIANNLRSMKRIWKGTDLEEDMNGRREAEAKLVESSIK
jgi:hypothetical protein